MIQMKAASTLTAVIKQSPYIARMSFDLLYMYLTLEGRVRKTRRAFEKQLILAGMSKDDAERLSSCFEELKAGITNSLKSGIVRSHRP
jgi:hypothetical protein